MLVEEVEDGLVAALILLAHLGVLQVRTSSHPAMDLGREGLDVVGSLQVVLEGLDVLGGLILGGQQSHGDIDLLCIIRVDHGGVALDGRLEGLVVLAGGQSRDLPTPAVTQDGPLEAATRSQLVGFRNHAGDPGERVRGSTLVLEEVTKLLLVLIGLRREPGDIGGLTLEEVGDEDTVLLLIGRGQDVGTLNGLVEETEDVYGIFLSRRSRDWANPGKGIPTVDDEDGLGGILGTGDIYSISVAPGVPCGSVESYKSLGH